MKQDARVLLNKKKWKKTFSNNKKEVWKNHGPVDARKILNLKRIKQTKPTVLGFMRQKSATALIAEQIKNEISAQTKVPKKLVQLSRDGNIIVTSKSKSISQVAGTRQVTPKLQAGGMFSRNKPVQDAMEYLPSTSVDELEHTAIEDLLDMDSLPPAYLAPKSLPRADLAEKSILSQVLDKKHTMVADQLSEYSNVVNSKVYVSNLHPSVSRQDVMELFSDIGVTKSIQMAAPGTAIIEFFHDEDAIKACEIYHNRLLDGLPMKCFLQSGSPQKFAISQRLGNRNELVVSSRKEHLSPTMFNPRSRYNPRNVQFTVKLP